MTGLFAIPVVGIVEGLVTEIEIGFPPCVTWTVVVLVVPIGGTAMDPLVTVNGICLFAIQRRRKK